MQYQAVQIYFFYLSLLYIYARLFRTTIAVLFYFCPNVIENENFYHNVFSLCDIITYAKHQNEVTMNHILTIRIQNG